MRPEDLSDAQVRAYHKALAHIRKADEIAQELHELFLEAEMMMDYNRLIASVYLATAGLGDDKKIYEDLGLPFTNEEES